MSDPIEVRLVARTDVGLIRAHNEDFVVVGDLDSGEVLELEETHALTLADASRGPLAVVCDGMGGGEHGAIASEIAATTAWKELAAETITADRVVFARQLRRSIRAANVAVRERAKKLESLAMGTTAACAGVVDGALVLALVGDCRAYIFRRGKLTQVTRDQSVVSALVSAGTLTDAEARASERRHMILQALGPTADVEVGLSLVELRRGDTLLLSSDGLHGVLEERYLVRALEETPGELGKTLDRLFSLAASAGAPDNISAVLVHFDGDGLRECRELDASPRFTEIDPQEDGDAALTATSNVGKRLAHRAGIRAKPGSPPLPATGVHAVLTVPITSKPTDGKAAPGPAETLLAARAGLSPAWWLIAVAVAAVIIIVLFTL